MSYPGFVLGKIEDAVKQAIQEGMPILTYLDLSRQYWIEHKNDELNAAKKEWSNLLAPKVSG